MGKWCILQGKDRIDRWKKRQLFVMQIVGSLVRKWEKVIGWCARWGGLNAVAAAPFPPHQTITPATPINLKMLFAWYLYPTKNGQRNYYSLSQ